MGVGCARPIISGPIRVDIDSCAIIYNRDLTTIVVDGHIYLHLRNQRFACLEIATGEERWITQPFGKYWSLIASGNRILALDERGELLLIRVNPEKFELIDRRKISSQPTWAHLAVVEGEIVIRELQGLMSLQWQEQ